MRIPLSWLRDYVPVTLAPEAIADVLASVGFEVAGIERIAPPPASQGPSGRDDADEVVIDLEVTANRPDALSVLGIAREVATALRLPLRPPDDCDPSDQAWAEPAPDVPAPHPDLQVSVVLEDAERCPRYAAATMRVRVAPSPAWLAHRLQAAGIRPISNVVDATNYVLLELGHPMHAFDLARLARRELRIRRAHAGESIRTLDGMQRTLADDMLVIADAVRAHAVAGVMGGSESEVSASTTWLALESAWFQPASVRRTSKRLGLKTEASSRFERGTSPAAPVLAIERFTRLLYQINAVAERGALIDRYPSPRPATVIQLRRSRFARVLGFDVEPAAVEDILARLGFQVETAVADTGESVWSVTVPPWRVDVTREVDVIEEVARHRGYDAIPVTFPELSVPPAPPDARLARAALIRRTLTAAGFSEATTFTFIEHPAALAFADEAMIVPLANPLSEKFAVLRPAMVSGVLDSVAHNRRRGVADVRLFELGSRFSPVLGEQRALGIVWVGAGTREHWSAKPRPADFFDLKGVVSRLCESLGVAASWQPDVQKGFEEGATAAVFSDIGGIQPTRLGTVGRIDPAVARDRGLPDGDVAFGAEVDIDALAQVARPRDDLHVAPLPRHPAIVRDLSIVVDEALPAVAVRGTIQAAAPPTLADLRVFDRYRGPGVAEGTVSLSLHLTFRASDRTLTDAEVESAMSAIVAALERTHGARRR